MGDKVEEFLEKIKEDAPELVKDNKGALIGLAIGVALSGSEKAQSAMLGAIAGALILDKKKDEY